MKNIYCPHCHAPDPWPAVVALNAEQSGGKDSACNCKRCGALIAVRSRRYVSVEVLGESKKTESDWFE